jgi:hypothetical protein
MRYIMFVAVDQDPDQSPAPLPSVDEWFDVINTNNQWIAGDRLRPVEEAKLVRVRNGEVLVTDAAFTESKEWIGGFDILECASMEEAIAIAAKHPMARGGRIEVREFWPLSDPGE